MRAFKVEGLRSDKEKAQAQGLRLSIEIHGFSSSTSYWEPEAEESTRQDTGWVLYPFLAGVQWALSCGQSKNNGTVSANYLGEGTLMSEEEKGFVIRDKRGRTESESQAAPASPSSSSTSVHSSGSPSSGTVAPDQSSPPINFSRFVLSLGTSALLLMGETLDPQQPTIPVNLPQAKEIIDILSILEAKTQGNLSPDERSVLTDMLYTLRMKYVEVCTQKPQSSSP